MKRFKWLLIGLVVSLAIVPLSGCLGASNSAALQAELAVSKSEFAALQTEHATLVDENTGLKAQSQTAQSDLTNKQADYEAVNQELAEIKEVYPPRDFSSLGELRDWLEANDVSEKPVTPNAEDWYGRAIEVQEDALRDGYIVSVDYDYFEDTDDYFIWCITIIDGDIWYWDPETDEAFQGTELGKVK